MKIFAVNKRAKYDYDLLDEYEAGLTLKGFEVKAIKSGRISLKGSFVTIKGTELYLTNSNIPLYQYAGKVVNYNPTASRKLLLRQKEIKYLLGKVRTEGLTLVPLSVYNKNKRIKLRFALARGKKQFDKRQRIKEREDRKRIERNLKNYSNYSKS